MIIVLNGTSSAGKTSIARALQSLSAQPMLHASLDTFTDMFRWDAISSAEQRQKCHATGVVNFHHALGFLAAGEFPLVVDHVFEQPAWYEATRAALSERPSLFVGVHCPLEVVKAREAARGDRRIGLAEFQFPRVHENKVYDLEVNTATSTPEACARTILDRAGLSKK